MTQPLQLPNHLEKQLLIASIVTMFGRSTPQLIERLNRRSIRELECVREAVRAGVITLGSNGLMQVIGEIKR